MGAHLVRYEIKWNQLPSVQNAEGREKKNVLRMFNLQIIYVFLFCSFVPPTAIWGELQPQLFVLELLQENHDWVLVDAGLPLARHQQDAHHMLLHPSDQFCRPHGPCGCQGRVSFFNYYYYPSFTSAGLFIHVKSASYQTQLGGMQADRSVMIYAACNVQTEEGYLKQEAVLFVFFSQCMFHMRSSFSWPSAKVIFTPSHSSPHVGHRNFKGINLPCVKQAQFDWLFICFFHLCMNVFVFVK